MTTYQLLDSGIFYVEFTGPLGLDEAKEYMDKFVELDYLSSPLRLLYDVRNAKLLFQMDELPILTKLAEESTAQYPEVKAAYLVDDPTKTAFSIVFKDLEKTERTSRNIFCTLEGAKRWLIG